MRHEQTLGGQIAIQGIGLHGGAPVEARLIPALPHTGVMFRRTDLGQDIPARFDRVGDCRLCTTVQGKDPRARVGTIEHLMAALALARIDNVVVEVSGPELPILDGSAAPWMALFEQVQVVVQPAWRRRFWVPSRIRVTEGRAWAEFRPGPHPLRVGITIQFPDAIIGTQAYQADMDDPHLDGAIASARTFVARRDIDALLAQGLARGGGLHNAVVLEPDRVVNPGGFRMPDECVKHKVLDAIGDLALAGGDIWGTFEGYCSGHALNNKALRALLAIQSEQVPRIRFA